MLLNREKRLEVYHHTSQDWSTTALLASNNHTGTEFFDRKILQMVHDTTLLEDGKKEK